ncbi:DUF58 domain-containing protein [Flavicella sp.]|uniref:DUF58 domain-containing protein n=1 Tax=Flavicella sp. TaxID=2957742 RepID=UPI00301AD177
MPNTQKSKSIKEKVIAFYISLYLNNLLFYILAGNTIFFVLAFIYPILFIIAKIILLITLLVFIFDFLTLYYKKTGISANRKLPEKLSNGDDNFIEINFKNHYPSSIHITILDEIPFQFQERDFNIQKKIKPFTSRSINYTLQPTKRGEYHFGQLHIYAKSTIGLISRRFSFEGNKTVKTYPSFLQLKKYDFLSINHKSHYSGIKKIRRIGQSFEFEQIKEYVQGDIIRDINWKATAKKNQLMTNQFQDEKSQQVYTIIDKGRVMKMPFNKMSLLDYAINSSLVFSNIVLRRQDKAGIFYFSKKTTNFVVAERRNSQMNLILESLYNVSTDFHESDYSNLYATIKRNITQRSLLLLFTNFESLDAVNRQMNYLRAINKSHLLVVIFFQNTELEKISNQKTETTEDIFDKTIAKKFMYDKKLIVGELKKYGIHTILTTPQDLTINSINKYLEIKAKGLL